MNKIYYEERFYREIMKARDLLCFNVTEGESDLQIFAGDDLEKEARRALIKCRSQLHEYIRKNPHFLTSLEPVKPQKNSPEIVRQMCRAAESAKVGPMAAVAGAVSRYVGLSLLKYTGEVIIENGGDIFLKTRIDRKISIYAGDSPFSNKIALLISGNDEELGICTSSGTVGHSLSFGKADAAVILARDAVLADAAATAAGNVVKSQKDIERGLETAMSIPGVEGALIIAGDKMGALGNINIIKP